MPQISILDARLAEIDRRLESIQTGLNQPDEPAPPPAPAPPTALPLRVVVPEPGSARRRAAEPIAVVDRLRELEAAHERLLESVRALLAALEHAPASNGNGSSAREFSVSAGPFETTHALRDFERSLAGIPDVRDVEIRAYEAGNRAIVDVRLFEPTS